MRAKKFRIWDIETKQFFYWSISENPPTCLTKEYIEKSSQESTGLKDKHGREIWEGDIVKYKFESGSMDRGGSEIKPIKFINGTFSPIPCEEECEDTWYSYRSFDFEVIGNVFENSELLTTQGEG